MGVSELLLFPFPAVDMELEVSIVVEAVEERGFEGVDGGALSATCCANAERI